ncbi:MAG: DUF2807 domain-containing protein [Bacteroidaceae bacterium]
MRTKLLIGLAIGLILFGATYWIIRVKKNVTNATNLSSIIHFLAEPDEKEQTSIETRQSSPFSKIDVKGIANVVFTQSDTFKIVIKANTAKHLRITTTEVSDNTLYLRTEDSRGRSNVAVTAYISAPNIAKLTYEGIGEFKAEKPLKLNDLEIQLQGIGNISIGDLKCRNLDVHMEGVGNLAIHTECENLFLDLQGVGSATLSGSTHTQRIKKESLGKLDTSNLKTLK